MQLSINDNEQLDAPTDADIQMALTSLGTDQFLILTAEPGHFVQTYHNADGTFELEYRQGASDQHFAVDPAVISIEDVKKAFALFLVQSSELSGCWDWQPVRFGPDVRMVDDGSSVPSDALVGYHGVLMSAEWPQEIEEAQELCEYLMHGQRLSRVPCSAGAEVAEPTGLCQECGVKVGQLHVPGCRHEQCPRCQGILVECACEIDED